MGGALTRGLRGYSRKWLSLGCAPQSSMLGPAVHYSCCASGAVSHQVCPYCAPAIWYQWSNPRSCVCHYVCQPSMYSNLTTFTFFFLLSPNKFIVQKTKVHWLYRIHWLTESLFVSWLCREEVTQGSDESIIVRALVCSQTLASTCYWGKWWLGHTSQHSELNLSLCSDITPGGVWEFGWRPYVVLGIKLKLATYKAKCLTHWTIALSHPHCLTECGLL